jgi:hypothetical protein
MDGTGEAAVDDITTLLHRRGSADDGGERVTQRACALQTAGQAEQQDNADFSVVRFRSDFVLASEEHPALHQKSGHKSNSTVSGTY